MSPSDLDSIFVAANALFGVVAYAVGIWVGRGDGCEHACPHCATAGSSVEVDRP